FSSLYRISSRCAGSIPSSARTLSFHKRVPAPLNPPDLKRRRARNKLRCRSGGYPSFDDSINVAKIRLGQNDKNLLVPTLHESLPLTLRRVVDIEPSVLR